MTDDVAVAEPADQANADVMNMLDHIAQANYEKANAIFKNDTFCPKTYYFRNFIVFSQNSDVSIQYQTRTF